MFEGQNAVICILILLCFNEELQLLHSLDRTVNNVYCTVQCTEMHICLYVSAYVSGCVCERVSWGVFVMLTLKVTFL